MFSAIASASRRVLKSTEFQSETLSYMTALGIPDNNTNSIYRITNKQLWIEVDTLIKSLKTNSILSKSFRIFPKIGNTAIQQSIDLIDPSRSGAFSGSWVFDQNGATGNGANTKFDSGFNINQMSAYNFGVTNTLLSIDLVNSGSYARIIEAHKSNDGLFIYAKRFDTRFAVLFNGAKIEFGSGTELNKIGVQTVNKTLSQQSYDFTFNGQFIFQGDAPEDLAMPNATITEASGFDPKSYIAGAIGTSIYHEGLTASQIQVLYLALETFESNINRKTW